MTLLVLAGLCRMLALSEQVTEQRNEWWLARLLGCMQELTRLQKLVQLLPIQEALKDKFSRFDDELNPTHDHQGNELEPKVTSLWQASVNTSTALLQSASVHSTTQTVLLH